MIKRSLTAEKLVEKQKDLELKKEEKELYDIFEEEYNEIFENILNLGEKAIFNKIITNATVLIGKEKMNSYSKLSLAKIQSTLKSQYYMPDILSVKKIREIILSLRSKNSFKKIDNLNIEDINPHCDNTSKCYHICGEEFFYFEQFNYIICLYCNMIYKPSQIHLLCKECNEDYYSEMYDKDEEQIEDYEKATWEEYHCKNYFYEDMKCPRCNEGLFFSNKRKIFKCFNCKWKNKISNTKFKCKICGEEFQSKVKIYIKFENKPKKVCVRNALIEKNYAKPNMILKCNCGADINKEKFFLHNLDCDGILLNGELQNKKVVICSICNEIIEYNKVEWLCPECDNVLENNIPSQLKNDNNTKYQKYNNGIYGINNNNYYNTRNKLNIITKNHSISNHSFNTNYIRKYSNENSTGNSINEENTIENEHSSIKSAILNNNLFDVNLTEYRPIVKKIPGEKSTKNIGVNILQKITQKKDLSSNNIIKINKTNSLIGPYVSYKRLPSNNKIFPQSNSIQVNFRNDSVSTTEDFINDNNQKMHNSNNENLSQKISRENSYIQNKSSENSTNKIINSNMLKNINLNFNVNININNFINPNNKNGLINPNIIEPDENFNPEDFIINKQVGEGTFGKIYSTTWIKNNLSYALKKIISPSNEELKNIRTEYELVINFIKKTKCEGIIKIYGAESKKLEEGNYGFFVLMELASIDWEKEIKKRYETKNFYTEGQLLNILKSLIKTLSKLQQNKIAHRDIKPQNILIVGNEYKICDFGEAKIINDNINNNNNENMIRGTELYMSPILFNALKKKKNIVFHNCFKSDVFSLGMCIFFASTLTFQSLYNIRELNDRESIKNIIVRYLVARYSFEFINVILRMLEIDEKKRPDFIELERSIRD